MKISAIAGVTAVIVTSISGFFRTNLAIAQWVPNESMFEGYTNDRINRMNQPGNRNSDGTVRGSTQSPEAVIGRKTTVMYIKNRDLDTGDLLEALKQKNLEVGFAEAGEEVTILGQQKKMRQVRFAETGRLGWVLQEAIEGL